MTQTDIQPSPVKDVKVEVKIASAEIVQVRRILPGTVSLSALTRALFEKWLQQGHSLISHDDLARHAESAPRGRPKIKR